MRNDGTQHHIRALGELREEFMRVARAESRMPSKRGKHRVRLTALTLVGLALFAGGAAARMVIDSAPEKAPPPAYAGFTRYQTLLEIVANSDLVVVGTVQEVAVGEAIPSEDGFPTQYLNTVLKVDEAWKGSPGDTVTVATIDVAYGNPGVGSEWRQPGVRVVAFLAPGDSGPPGLFYPSDEPAIYVLSGDQVIPTVQAPLSTQIAAMSFQELSEAVRAATMGE
jgi:hypothetical protein